MLQRAILTLNVEQIPQITNDEQISLDIYHEQMLTISKHSYHWKVWEGWFLEWLAQDVHFAQNTG